MKKNILYLTWGESVFDSGIFKNLISAQLFGISKLNDVKLSVLSGIPLLRKKRFTNKTQWKEDKKLLQENFLNNDIKLFYRNIFIPSSFFRSKFYEIPFMYLGHILFLKKIIKKNSYDVVWCRSYHATVISCLVKFIFKMQYKIIFDTRSIFPEECVLTGRIANNSFSFRLWKNIEKKLIKFSDHIVNVSEGLSQHFTSIHPTEMTDIYASIDMNVINSSLEYSRKDLSISEDEIILSYLGSITQGSFHSIEYLVLVYNELSRLLTKSIKLLIITQSSKEVIIKAVKNLGLSEEDCIITRANSIEECHAILKLSDYQVIPFKSVESDFDILMADTMIGSKVPEYLLTGKSIIYNKEVKCLSNIFKESKVAIPFSVVDGKAIISHDDLVNENIDHIEECFRILNEKFSLQASSSKYNSLLKRI